MAFVEIDSPARMVTTEKFDEAWYPGEASVVMEEKGVTTVTQVIEYDSAATRDGVMRSPMKSGVRVSYNRLAGMLE
jgi:hypothetical protein